MKYYTLTATTGSHDGYSECLFYLRSGLSPIFKLRAVINSNGKYSAVVRDYETGKMVASNPPDLLTELDALKKAEELTVSFIKDSLGDITEDYSEHHSYRVVSAAVLMKDGLIVPGVRHFSPDMRVVLQRIYGDNYHLQVEEQGFIDSHGNFLSRKDAWVRADQNGQIFIYDPTGKGKPLLQPANQGTEGMLFSENLY